MVGYILYGRLKSTRLPKKGLLQIDGKSLIKIFIERVSMVKSIDKIVFATSDLEDDKPIADLAVKEGLEIFCGHPEDVIQRLYNTAQKFKFDVIVTTTIDSPFQFAEIIDPTVYKIKYENYDMLYSYPNMPNGIDCYGFKTEALKKVIQLKSNENTECFGPYFTNTGLFKWGEINLFQSYEEYKDFRLTIDYPEDYDFCKKIYNDLVSKYGSNFNLKNLIELFGSPKYLNQLDQIKKRKKMWENHFSKCLISVQNDIQRIKMESSQEKSEEFNFQQHTNLQYGIGISKTLGSFINSLNYRNILVLVDTGVQNTRYFETVRNNISNNVDFLEVFSIRCSEEPDYTYLDEIAQKARKIETLDLIIGIGGGTCMDISKGVAILKTNSGNGIDYRGFDKVINQGIPTILIPTTAGTGSEATINAVFIDKIEKRKLGINGKFLNATYAVLDSEWTLTCPEFAAVSSGMDALTHTLESYCCKQSNLLTKNISKQAFKLLYENLPCLTNDPKNKEMRQKLLLGSYLAGIALFNSGSGIAGALSYPIGVHYKVPHGMGGAIFLASVIEYNIENGYYEYADLYKIVEPGNNLSEKEASKQFLKIIQNLSEILNVPKYLNQWGITKENVNETAKLMISLQGAFDQNPVRFQAEKNVLPILEKHVW